MKWKGFKDVHATLEIDLTKPEEELLKSFTKDARYCIRKSSEHGFSFEKSENKEDWNEFYPIYCEIMSFGGVVPKKLEFLKQRENYPLFLIRKSGKIIGGMAGSLYPEKFGLSLASINPEFNKENANYFAYWELIKFLKKIGLKTFDMGGYQLNAKEGEKLYNINKFKEQWGGELKYYPVYSYNPLYILGRKAIRRFSVLKRIKEYLSRFRSVR